MATLAIINPRSGHTDDLSRVASLIRHHPDMEAPEIRITGEQNDAALIAGAGVEHGFRRIFSVGGDGTLNEVVNGIMGVAPDLAAEVEIGLIPLGTGNDFARSLGLSLDFETTLDDIAALRPVPADVIRISGEAERYCVNVSAGGFSGEVDEQVTPERKRSWGPLAYLRGALDVLPDPESYQVEVVVDGGEPRPFRAINLVVANGRTVAGGVPVAPSALLDDGLLDLVVVREASMSRLATFGSRCLVGKHLDHDLCEHVVGKGISIRSDPNMPFNIDGELLARTPLDYEVLPGALRFLADPDAPAFGGRR